MIDAPCAIAQHRQPVTPRRLGRIALTVLVILATLAAPALATTPSARLDDGRAFHAQATPGQPGRPTAVAGNARATITIVPPTSGGTVTGYRVRVVGDNSSQCLIAAGGTSCVVTDLINGSAYSFESVAFGTGDSSTWSEASAAVTPVGTVVVSPPTSTPTPTVSIGVLAPPATVSLFAGTASLTAAWASVSGATGYTATAHPGPATCTVTATTCVLGAVAGTPYTVTVVAHANNGDSVPSAVPTVVIPRAPTIPTTVPSTASPTLTTAQGQIGLAIPGQAVTLVGTGFAPSSTVTLALYSTPIDLGDVTADATGAISQRLGLPTGLAPGSHTLLAIGVDAQGSGRQISLPLTVAPATLSSSGKGPAVQTVQLPIPAAGSVWLLDESGLTSTVVSTPGGTHTLARRTGVISFVPIDGFGDAAAAVRYQITDAIGTVVTGVYTPTVVGVPAAPILRLPNRIVSSTGDQATALVPCALTGGWLARCVVTTTAVVADHPVVIGYGVKTPTPLQDLQQVNVQTVLTELGRLLAARPGGVRATFTAELIQRDHAGRLSARDTTNLVAQSYDLPRMITFGVGSSAVDRADAAYLSAANDKITEATEITCAGHADSQESGRSTLGVRRAKAACAVLAKGLDATVHTAGTVDEHPVGEHNTPAARALNRRVDITVDN